MAGDIYPNRVWNGGYFVSLTDIPWEDVIYKYIFPRLSWAELFQLRSVSTSCKELVSGYFCSFRHVDIRRYAYRMTPDIFNNIIKDNFSIRLLYLQNSNHWMTDDVLVPVLERNNKLHTLDVTGCSNLGYGTIHIVSLSCKNLTKIVLKDCHWLSPSQLQTLSKNLVKLEHLDLSGCWSVTDEAVITLAVCCSQLTYLSLAKIYGLTDSSIEQLCRLSKLKRLNIHGCWRVTNDSMRQLAIHCSSIEALEVKDCGAITEVSLGRLRARGVLMDKPKPPYRCTYR